MKRLFLSFASVLFLVLAGCSSTKMDSIADSTWMQIQPGMTKQEAYAKLGQPIREADRESEWRRPEGNGWRVVVVSFDQNGRVAVVRGQHEHE